MTRLLAILVLLSGAVAARADDPTLEELIARLVELRKQKAEQEKTEAEVVKQLRTRYEALHKQLADLGVVAPGPLPPAPPPKPVDELKQKVQAAWKADGGTREMCAQLAELYKLAAQLAQSESVPSTAELLRQVREAASFLTEGAMQKTRQLVAEELRKALGKSTDDPITDVERKAASELFAKLATILEGF